jgi:hypothetical protein
MIVVYDRLDDTLAVMHEPSLRSTMDESSKEKTPLQQ